MINFLHREIATKIENKQIDLNKCNMIGMCLHIRREPGSMAQYPIFLSIDLPKERRGHC
jgi:hypothetical protein